MNMLTALLFVGSVLITLLACHHWLNHVERALPRFGRTTILMAFPIMFLLTGVGVFGRFTHSLEIGLLGALALAFAFWGWSRRLAPELVFHAPMTKVERWSMAAALGIIILLYGVIATQYQMHDEFALFGHKSMIEQLRNGAYPPYLPPFPEQDARYHYGFDIIAGILARAFAMSSDAAIDLLTVYLAVLISCAAAALASQVKPRRFTAAFAVLAIHLSSGLSWLILAGVKGRHPRCLVQYHHPTCGVDPFYPMPLLNIFQHPVAMGVAMVLVLVLLSKPAVNDARLGRKFFLPILFLVPALALGQIVYFTLGLLAVLTALVLSFTRSEFRAQPGVLKQSLQFTGILLLGGVGALLAGGMFTPSEVNQTGLVIRLNKIGFPAGVEFAEMWRQHLANLGLGFALLPVFGLVALIRRNWTVLVLSAFASGGILVPHFWAYTRSWDIVKFPSASAFMLALLCVILIDGQVWINVWLRRTARTLLIAGGVLAATYLVFPPEPSWRFYEVTNKRVDKLVGQTIEWFRKQDYHKDQVVLTQSNIASLLSVYGGLSVVGSDSDFHYLGIRSDILRRQSKNRRAAVRELDPAALKALGVRWLMFSNEELKNLGPQARAELSNPDSKRFEMMAEFKAGSDSRTRKIWRLVEPE